MNLEPELDPRNCAPWVLVEDNEWFRRYELDQGDGTVILRTEHKGTEKLLEDNSQEQKASLNKRWGAGQVIGSVPLHLYYSSGLAEANRQHDDKFIKRFWNNSDHAKFRRFGGRV